MRRARLGVLAVTLLLLGLAGLAGAEVVQRAHIRVSFQGRMAPTRLPREKAVPVGVSVATKIATTNGAAPPRLQAISIAINRAGRFDTGLVPICTVSEIQPSSTEKAMEACGSSVIGGGRFAAKLLVPRQAAFPSAGKLVAFNGTYRGRPAILAHVYGTEPVPTSLTLPFVITRRRGELGTVLSASLAGLTGKSGYITELVLDLGRTVGFGKGRQGYLEAACPAPKGFSGAAFPFARASFDFGTRKLSSTIVRRCEVRG